MKEKEIKPGDPDYPVAIGTIKGLTPKDLFCPLCSAKLELKLGDKGMGLYCSCGYFVLQPDG